jgi:hypothetical protein
MQHGARAGTPGERAAQHQQRCAQPTHSPPRQLLPPPLSLPQPLGNRLQPGRTLLVNWGCWCWFVCTHQCVYTPMT